MKFTCITYNRQSTNRSWMQENSIDAQLKNNSKTVKEFNFLLWEDIIEKESAKESNNREWFKRLMNWCDSGKVDYIIVDEADRLSRDDLDSAIFMTILRKWKIKWVVVGGKIIACDDI